MYAAPVAPRIVAHASPIVLHRCQKNAFVDRAWAGPRAAGRIEHLFLHRETLERRRCGRGLDRHRLRRDGRRQSGRSVLLDVVALLRARRVVDLAAVVLEDPFDEAHPPSNVGGAEQVVEARRARDVGTPARVGVAALPRVPERAVGAREAVGVEPLTGAAAERLPLLWGSVDGWIASLRRELGARGAYECERRKQDQCEQGEAICPRPAAQMRHTKTPFQADSSKKTPEPPGERPGWRPEDSTVSSTYRIVRAVPDVLIFADTVRSPSFATRSRCRSRIPFSTWSETGAGTW